MNSQQYRIMDRTPYTEKGERYPSDVVEFSNWNGGGFVPNTVRTKHPTQKPVPLCEYLILTYTNPGDTVLDNCMGSGTTGVACVKSGRNFIGMEISPEYFAIAESRIKAAQAQPSLFTGLSEDYNQEGYENEQAS